MTPVATPVAVCATSWDAALAETLSQAACRASTEDACIGRVHSVHARAVNLQCADTLIALVDDELDDAPATIRVPALETTLTGIRIGDDVRLHPDRIQITTSDDVRTIALTRTPRWQPEPIPTQTFTAAALAQALRRLESCASDPEPTDFGRASAALLDEREHRLRVAALARLRGTRRHDAAVTAAADSLIGLGEGLTPTGDDILTGLALVAAQHVFGLGRLIAPLTASIASAAERTTLLSAVTLTAAVSGRGRARLHDLIAAVALGDDSALADAIRRTLEIGHTSGHDILTGIRLALELAAEIHPDHPTPEGDHR